MKNIFKYPAIPLLCALLLISCEDMVDYQHTVEAPDRMAYLDAGTANTVSATITHSPAGSFFSLGQSFKVMLNSTTGSEVRLAADNSLVAAYNQEHSTGYGTLPEGSVGIDPVVIAMGTTYTTVSSGIHLNGELSSLSNANGYLVPIRIQSASDAKFSETKGTVYMIIAIEKGNIRALSSTADIFATPITPRTGWSVNQPSDGANMFDGDAATYATIPSAPYTQVIDLGGTKSFDGIRLMVWGTGTALPNVQIETSTDGTAYTDAGVANNTKYVTQSTGSRVYQYVMFYTGVEARYVRLTTSTWSANRRICEFDLLKTDISAGVIYTDATGFSGTVYHTPKGSTTNLSAEFDVKAIVSSANGYTVNIAVDNSLIAAYNTANGTSYAAIPGASVSIGNSAAQIDKMRYSSASKVKVSLANLSSLTDANGYLIPLKLSCPAGVIAGKDVVYVTVRAEKNLFVENPGPINVTGILVAGRSAWTVDADGVAVTTLTDGNNTTYVQAPGVVTVTMDKEYTVGALKLYNYNAAANIPTVKVEYSTDGTTYASAGTADAGRYFVNDNNQHMVFMEPVKVKYLKLTLKYSGTSTNNRLYELNVYENPGTGPLVYATANPESSIPGSTIFHSPINVSASAYGQFFPCLTMAADKDIKVDIVQDNSLVAAYNTANGTAYGTIPSGNVVIANASLSIPAGKLYNTRAAVSISFTGDLSAFDDLANGYLVPVKVESGAGVVPGKNVVYYVIAADYNNMLQDPDQAKIFGAQAARTGWTAKVNGAASTVVTDNSTSTYIANATTIEVDMASQQWLSGIRLDNSQTTATYHPATLKVEYSMDATTWQYAGVAGTDRRYQTGNNTYYMFYTPIHARHIRLTPTYSSTNTNNRIREVYVYDAQAAEPRVFISGGSNAAGGAIVSTIAGGTIFHTPAGTQSSTAASITTYLTTYNGTDITATAALDNSLVAAYNSANSTNYGTIPADNIVIGNSSQLIREGFAQSLTTITVSLKGNLSALNDVTNGYVVPVKISVPAGVGLDAAHSVVYVTINAVQTNVKTATLADMQALTAVPDRSGWGPAALANLFDGNNSTTVAAAAFPQGSATVITLGRSYTFKAVRFYVGSTTASRRPTDYLLESSTDGTTYTTIGTANASTIYNNTTTSNALVGQSVLFYAPVTASYIRVTPSGATGYTTMAEFQIYTE